jgi:hypothetical protein
MEDKIDPILWRRLSLLEKKYILCLIHLAVFKGKVRRWLQGNNSSPVDSCMADTDTRNAAH